VLKGVNFAIGAGDVLGVIGPSGSGKSTLARLLVGVWPSVVGRVRLDGADIYQWNKGELGPHLGYLPQDIELFAGTVSENIARFGEVDAEKVVQAAKRAGVHDLILHFPKGYDTLLGDGGAGLSGGQRQRLAWPAPCTATRRCWCWMNQTRTWTMWAKRRWCAPSMTCASAARPSC
jgi:ATP-binding cassette subfamily C exporter for protease/lipase